MKPLQKNKVILGLSGGVDSTTAALLLKEKGLEVTGLFLDVLGNNHEGVADAERAAAELGIDFMVRDVSQRFSDIVIRNFCSEYICGRTPNPCVICNPNVKFRTLIDAADEAGAYYIATGHYARIVRNEQNGCCFVEQAQSQQKDQSYMLYRLGQEVLSRLLFPLGDVQNKTETRALARKHSLFNAEKADSQEICFIEDGKKAYVDFIEKRHMKSAPGDFIDARGRRLGTHKGLINYTIGQRKGLGITLGRPAFVTRLDADKNTVTLGSNADLFSRRVISDDNFFVENSSAEMPKAMAGQKLLAKIRYAAKPSEAVIERLADGRIMTVFDQPQRAATPGQSIVFYLQDEKGVIFVAGGGYICSND